MAKGVDGLLWIKSQPPGKAPLLEGGVKRVVDLTVGVAFLESLSTTKVSR